MTEISEPTSSTIVELEQKLKDLETRFLGTLSDQSSVNPSSAFAPISTIRKRIESFQVEDPHGPPKETLQSELPPVTLPTFDGSDLDYCLKRWHRWLRLCGLVQAPDQAKLDWLVEACTPKVQKLVEKVVEDSNNNLHHVLLKLEELFPRLENDITIRGNLEKIPQLPANPEPSQVAQLFIDFEENLSRLSKDAMSEQEKLIFLVKKLHPKTFLGFATRQVLQAPNGGLHLLKTSTSGQVKRGLVGKTSFGPKETKSSTHVPKNQ